MDPRAREPHTRRSRPFVQRQRALDQRKKYDCIAVYDELYRFNFLLTVAEWLMIDCGKYVLVSLRFAFAERYK